MLSKWGRVRDQKALSEQFRTEGWACMKHGKRWGKRIPGRRKSKCKQTRAAKNLCWFMIDWLHSGHNADKSRKLFLPWFASSELLPQCLEFVNCMLLWLLFHCSHTHPSKTWAMGFVAHLCNSHKCPRKAEVGRMIIFQPKCYQKAPLIQLLLLCSLQISRLKTGKVRVSKEAHRYTFNITALCTLLVTTSRNTLDLQPQLNVIVFS